MIADYHVTVGLRLADDCGAYGFAFLSLERVERVDADLSFWVRAESGPY